MLCCFLFTNGLILFFTWIFVVTTENVDRDNSEACNKLSKSIAKEYECCLQERRNELPIPGTSWFPMLPSLTAAATELNLTMDELIQLFCSREAHDVACIHQMSSRVTRAGKCVSNDTAQLVRVQAIVQDRRWRYLCDRMAIKAIYKSGASECLRDKPSSLCMRYLMRNIDLEAIKNQPNLNSIVY